MRWRALALGSLAVAVIAVLIVFGFAPSKNPQQGKAAPALPREHLGGADVTLPQLLAASRGGASLVVFWASWCDPCTTEAPAIESFSRSPQGRGRIVGVDWSDGRSGALSFLHRFGWSFPTLRDAEGTVGSEYGLTGLPTTFVLDAKGRIRQVLRGPQTGGSLERALRRVEAL